jgi:hypothetical protein
MMVVSLAAACSNPTSPQLSFATGQLVGKVTIGPICPVEQVTMPCPTPPEAYAARHVEIYDSAHAHLLKTVGIDSSGNYAVDLIVGNYVVDLEKVGIDRSADVPRSITILQGSMVRVDISIDTGIR